MFLAIDTEDEAHRPTIEDALGCFAGVESLSVCAARPTDGALLGALLRSASFQGEHLRTVGPVARLLCTHTHRVMSRRYLRAHDIECRRPSFSVGRLDANAPHQVPPAHPYHTHLPLPMVSFQDASTEDKPISRPPHLLRSLNGRHTTRSPRGCTGPPPRPHARPRAVPYASGRLQFPFDPHPPPTSLKASLCVGAHVRPTQHDARDVVARCNTPSPRTPHRACGQPRAPHRIPG